MKIVVIPARSGSKRIKNKNLRSFLNKPILLYTLDKLESLKFFDKIYVSTNSSRIKNIISSKNIQVIDRPNNLADDYSTTYDVMHHSIKKIDNNIIDYYFCVYPTSVFIEKNILNKAIKIFKSSNYDYVFTVKKTNYSSEKIFNLKKNKIINYSNSLIKNKRSQDMKFTYIDAAQLYLGSKNSWINKRNIYTSKTFPLDISNKRSIDIDDINDWKLAEYTMRKNYPNRNKKDVKLIDEIEKIRTKNNINWMDILRIAMKYSPKETKSVLKNINEKDQNISKLLKSLSE